MSISPCGIGGISVGIGTAPIGQGGGGEPLNWDFRPNSLPTREVNNNNNNNNNKNCRESAQWNCIIGQWIQSEFQHSIVSMVDNTNLSKSTMNLDPIKNPPQTTTTNLLFPF